MMERQQFAATGVVFSKLRHLRLQLDDLAQNELGARRVGKQVNAHAAAPRCLWRALFGVRREIAIQ
jgi:hypothetical protein